MAYISRKFLVVLLAIVLTALLCAFNRIGETSLSTIFITIVTAYLAANVTQKAVVKEA